MGYRQLKPFYPQDMTKKKGWCLENVARGFHIYGVKSAQPSAKADMEFNRAKGTLHPMNTLPTNVAVPVYVDTPSKYEHIEVSDKCKFWSDGVVVGRPSNCFGWGEWCNGVRIVEWVNDHHEESFLPSRGYWKEGDTDARIGRLADFMYKTFPAYTKKEALGNYFGKNIRASITEFQRRCHLEADGCVGRITYNKLKEYGFKG